MTTTPDRARDAMATAEMVRDLRERARVAREIAGPAYALGGATWKDDARMDDARCFEAIAHRLEALERELTLVRKIGLVQHIEALERVADAVSAHCDVGTHPSIMEALRALEGGEHE